jgi:hypothetical protein
VVESRTAELVGVSRQVLYDFEMVEALAKRQVDLMIGPQDAWRERFDTGKDLRRDWFEVNAMLESMLMHARSLTDFFYEPPPTAERMAARARRAKASGIHDRFAEHWFDDPLAWRKERGKRPPELTPEALGNRVGREIAHVTTHRADFTDRGPDWPPFAIYTAVSKPMETFVGMVDPVRVCDDFRERVEAADSLRRPPAYKPHRPGGYSVGPLAAATQAQPSREG